MKILTVAFMVFSAFYTKGFCADNMNFSEDDLKKFSLSTRPQKARNIERIDQKTDVIYFKKDTESTQDTEKAIRDFKIQKPNVKVIY